MMETQKTYRYFGLFHLYKIVFKTSIIISFLAILPLFILIVFRSPALLLSFSSSNLILTIGFIVVMTIPMPILPNVKIDNEGLLVESFWQSLRLPWNKIINVQQLNIRMRDDKFWLVKTNALTPFHRFYSLLFSRSFEPSFLINSRMKDHEILIAELKKSQNKAKNLLKKYTRDKPNAG